MTPLQYASIGAGILAASAAVGYYRDRTSTDAKSVDSIAFPGVAMLGCLGLGSLLAISGGRNGWQEGGALALGAWAATMAWGVTLKAGAVTP